MAVPSTVKPKNRTEERREIYCHSAAPSLRPFFWRRRRRSIINGGFGGFFPASF